MKGIYSYLKYRIKTEKLMFIGWVLCCHLVIGSFGDFMKYGGMSGVFIVLLSYKRKKEIVDFEKTLPVNSKTKIVTLILYAFMVLSCALLFGKIKDINIIKGVILGWVFIFLFKVYNEKYDLKKVFRIKGAK